LFSLWY